MNEFSYKELAEMAEDMIERATGEDVSRLMTIHNAFLRVDSIVGGNRTATTPALAPGFLARTREAVVRTLSPARS